MNNDHIIWAMFYANIMAMEHHPGNKPLGIADYENPIERQTRCAYIADNMLHQYKRRFGENTCQHSSQEPPSSAANSSEDSSEENHKNRPTPQTSDYNANNATGKNE